MNKYLPYILLSLLFLACFCGRNNETTDEAKEEKVHVQQEKQEKREKQDKQEKRDIQTSADFVPQTGMELQFFAGMPNVEWDFDTIRGLCAPDTLMLWLTYKGIDYPTNVYGVNGQYSTLSKSGEKKIINDGKRAVFTKADFTPKSKIISTYGLNRRQFSELNDTLYKYDTEKLIDVVRNFFLSKGDVQYMSKPMARNWQLIYTQAEDPDVVSTNPFNRSPQFNFESSSLHVTLTDPSKGILEVAALCTDPYTVGGRGWAYWTVKTCREKDGFKIKETPAQHRKFTY